jgi:hypothetical protein
MRSTKLFIYCLLLSIVYSFWGCSNSLKNIDFGVVDGLLYRQEYFNLSLTIPADWQVFDRAQIDNINNAGKNILRLTEAERAELEESLRKSISLFGCSMYETGALQNANLLIGATSLEDTPTIKTAKEYALIFERALKTQTMNKYVELENKTFIFGGQDFALIHIRFSINGMEGAQQHYVTLQKGYAINFTLTYFNTAQLKVLLETMESIKMGR